MKKRKDGYYKVSKVIDGKQKCFYGKSKHEAIKKMEEYSDKITSPLFRDIAEDWYEHHSSALAYNSLRGLKPAVNRAVDEFGDILITEITPSDLSQYIIGFANRGYADKTVRTQLGVFNMVFKYAINFKGINISNPARDITVPRNLPKKRITLPDDADIKKVKESVNEDFGLFAYILMYTGLRRAELLALTWEDVDLKEGYITVDKSLYYVNSVPHIKRPKTESGVRRIPILDKLRPYLTGGKGVIFNEAGEYLPEHIYIRKWKEYRRKSGIHCSPHQLRHCFATMLFESNSISPKDSQYVLGHAQLSTTMDLYTDIRRQREQDIGKAIRNIDIRVSDRV